jgi:hypothetical protein
MLLFALACAPVDPEPADLTGAFNEAAETYDVPYSVLVATSWSLSRFDARDGEPSTGGEVELPEIGVMALHVDGTWPALDDAAALIGEAPSDVAASPRLSILGAAAMLHQRAQLEGRMVGDRVDTLKEWYPLVAEWSGADDPLVADGFAAQVYDYIQWGFAGEAPSGEVVIVEPEPMEWRTQRADLAGSSLSSQFVPACSSNYSDYSSRGIDTVVIHTVQGSYSGAISWFQNCSASVSAHYVVRSSDGQITQQVDETDVAWHAGHWDTNESSIGIEHEGYVEDPGTWYTDNMYRSSAALVSDICDRYGIPKDRSHIIGHYEVPGCSTSGGGGSGCHTDPGSGWDWDYFMGLVTGTGSGSSSMGGSGVSDGPRTGTFKATATATRYGETDTCEGAVSGSINASQLYLTSKCTLKGNPDKVSNESVTWSGTVVSNVIDGKMTVDGHSASFTGSANADGSISIHVSGDEDLGGEVGTVSYDVTVTAN